MKGKLKVLIAGASGAIGQPLILYVLDREAVFSTMGTIRPDIVIDMLTHLPKEYTPESMRKSAELNAKIRLEGGSNTIRGK